jgi:hypothetical protein
MAAIWSWAKKMYTYGKVLGIFLLIKATQKLNKTVMIEGNGKYEIQYILHDKIYRIRTKHRRGPKKIEKVEDETGKDITDRFFSYLGPNLDFHGNPMSPHDLSYQSVRIHYRNGNSVYIEGDCKIHMDEMQKTD